MLNSISADTQCLVQHLIKLSVVTSVADVVITKRIIEKIKLETKSAGRLVAERLKLEDVAALFTFYFNDLSEESRKYWPPYPLFSPPVQTVEELADRITDWQRENDWTVLLLRKERIIIGVGLLKRYKTERPVSGLAVSEQYRSKGLGTLIQTIINEQARLLGLKKLYATLAADNLASAKVHERCGFMKTGEMKPHFVYRDKVKVVDRQDIEMVLQFDNEKPI